MELRDIQDCLRTGIASRATAVGPFLVLLNESSATVFFNYAVPVDGAEPTAADVQALIAFFAEHDRQPRLEYVQPWPAVDKVLLDAGFDVAPTLTLMALDTYVPPPSSPGYVVALATDEATLRGAVVAQNVAYEEPSRSDDPSGMLRSIAAGGCVAVALTDDGVVVGAGAFTPPVNGLVEVGAVGIVPEHRRRGLGRLVTSALTAEAERLGYRPFLQVEKDEPERLYERIGYRVIGGMADARL